MTVKKISFAVLLLIIMNSESVAAGQTYYVATTGRDSNPGTESLPFRTIRRGAANLKPGDRLYVKSGIYTEALINNIPGGTSWDNPATVAVFPGHSVTLKAPGESSQVLSFAAPTQRYIVIDGFTIDGANAQDQVIKISQDHIRLQNTEIINLAQSGLGISVVAGDSDTTIGCCNEFINLNLHDDRANPERKATVGLTIESAGNLVEGSKIHSHWGDGVLLGGDFGSNNNVIRNNQIFNNGRSGTGDGLRMGRGSGNLASNNIIFANAGGISVGDQSHDAQIYNNTVYHNKAHGIVIHPGNRGSFDTEVRNNIVYKNGRNIVGAGTNTVLSTNFEKDPLFVNTGERDFRLQSRSAAIDAGETISEIEADFDGVLRPQGFAYDIGAHEFIGSEPAATPLTDHTIETTATARANANFNFALANAGRKRVAQGQAVSTSITATLVSGAASAVSFSTSGLPTGATASYSLTSCSPTCSTTLNIATSTATPTGEFQIRVRASSSGITKTTRFYLRVVNGTTPTFDFSLTNGGDRSVTSAQSIGIEITAALISGSTQPVSFSTSELPAGAKASYAASPSCTPTCTRTLNIATSASTPAGTYTITVTGTSGTLKKTTSFTLTVNPNTVGVLDVTWADNSANENGFAIERRTGADGAFGQITTVATNMRSYTDSGLRVGSTYCYRVNAFNSTGTSAYSNEACGVARLP